MNFETLVEKSHHLIADKAYGEAVSVLRQSIDIDSNNPEIWKLLSNSLKELGRHQEAAAAYNRATKLNSLSNYHSHQNYQISGNNVNIQQIEYSEGSFLDRYYSSLAKLDLKNRELLQAREDHQWYEDKLKKAYFYAKKVGDINVYNQLNSNRVSCLQLEKSKVEVLVNSISNLTIEYQNFLVLQEDKEQKLLRTSNNTIEELKQKLSTIQNSSCSDARQIAILKEELDTNEKTLEINRKNLDGLKSANLKELIILISIAITSALLFKNIVIILICLIIFIFIRRNKYDAIYLKYDYPGYLAFLDEYTETVPFQELYPSEEWSFDSRKEIRAPIGLEGARNLLEFWMGKNDDGQVISNGLLAGKPGAGKSFTLHAIITSLAMRYSPKELEMYLLDFKEGVEFQTYVDPEKSENKDADKELDESNALPHA